MDGVCRHTGVERKDFCRTSCRRQEDNGALQPTPNAHHGRYQRCLARSCIAAQHKSPVVARVGQETPDLGHCFSLVGCEIVRELCGNALFEKCSYRHLFASALRKKEKLTEP